MVNKAFRYPAAGYGTLQLSMWLQISFCTLIVPFNVQCKINLWRDGKFKFKYGSATQSPISSISPMFFFQLKIVFRFTPDKELTADVSCFLNYFLTLKPNWKFSVINYSSWLIFLLFAFDFLLRAWLHQTCDKWYFMKTILHLSSS